MLNNYDPKNLRKGDSTPKDSSSSNENNTDKTDQNKQVSEMIRRYLK